MQALILIGDHPLLAREQGWTLYPDWPDQLRESCIVAFRRDGSDPMTQDSRTFAELSSRLSPGEGHLLCRVLVHHPQSAVLYARIDVPGVEIHPFTMEGAWAESLLGPGGAVQLDGKGIGQDDDRCVRLVLFGMTPAAEALALQTLRTAHFPNYIRNHRLRTRITWVDPDALEGGRRFVARHKSLMDVSWYRFIDLQAESVRTHRPGLLPGAEEYVDVEWEFVQAQPWDALLKAKLDRWTRSGKWHVVVAFAYGQDGRNLEAFQYLENCTGAAQVLIHLEDDALAAAAGLKAIPFGMSAPFHRQFLRQRALAMALNSIYNQTARDGRTPATLDREETERLWCSLAPTGRRASLDSIQCLGVKMRSLGLQEEDWTVLYGLDAESLDLLSQVEHNRWSVATLLAGFRAPTAEEQAAIDQDISLKPQYKAKGIHYDLRSYADLRDDEKGNDSRLYDMTITQCIPLIVHAVAGEDLSYD